MNSVTYSHSKPNGEKKSKQNKKKRGKWRISIRFSQKAAVGMSTMFHQAIAFKGQTQTQAHTHGRDVGEQKLTKRTKQAREGERERENKKNTRELFIGRDNAITEPIGKKGILLTNTRYNSNRKAEGKKRNLEEKKKLLLN